MLVYFESAFFWQLKREFLLSSLLTIHKNLSLFASRLCGTNKSLLINVTLLCNINSIHSQTVLGLACACSS